MCAGHNSQQGWALHVQDYSVSLYRKTGILRNLAIMGAGAKRAALHELMCQTNSTF